MYPKSAGVRRKSIVRRVFYSVLRQNNRTGSERFKKIESKDNIFFFQSKVF